MNRSMRLDHAVIAVSDRARSNRFYSEVLGAAVTSDGTHTCYRLANAQLNVHGPDKERSPRARVPVVPGNSDLCLIWDGSITEAIDFLEVNGVPVELGPVDRFGSQGPGKSVYFRDPDGSLLEFISYSA